MYSCVLEKNLNPIKLDHKFKHHECSCFFPEGNCNLYHQRKVCIWVTLRYFLGSPFFRFIQSLNKLFWSRKGLSCCISLLRLWIVCVASQSIFAVLTSGGINYRLILLNIGTSISKDVNVIASTSFLPLRIFFNVSDSVLLIAFSLWS